MAQVILLHVNDRGVKEEHIESSDCRLCGEPIIEGALIYPDDGWVHATCWMPAVKFWVEGQPIPKARPRISNGHAYTPQRTKDWEETVAWTAKAVMGAQKPLEGPLKVTLFFHGARANADADNLAKSLLDGLQGIIFKNDSQVTRLDIARAPGEPKGVEITVNQLGG